MTPVEVASLVTSLMATGRVVLARSLLPLPAPQNPNALCPYSSRGSLAAGWAGVHAAGRASRGRRAARARCRSGVRHQAPDQAWIMDAVETWRVDRRTPRNRLRPCRVAVPRSRLRGCVSTSRSSAAIPAVWTGSCRRRSAPRQALALARRGVPAGITEPPRRTGGTESPRTCTAFQRVWLSSRVTFPSG